MIERRATFRWAGPLSSLAAIGVGALSGFLDLHATEVQGPAAVVLLGAGLLGFAQPRHAWRWALLVGMGIPCAHWLLDARGIPQPYPITPWYSVIILPLLFALVAAYVGAGVRNIARASVV
jgi:hypothetical protein